MMKKSKTVMLMNACWAWIRAFWSVVFVLVAGQFFFRDAIVQSIQSTPHPALVYVIFATAGLAVMLFAYSLYRYRAEDRLIACMHNSSPQERTQLLDRLRWKPDLLPVYRLLISLNAGATHVRAGAFESELAACEGRVLARLTLPEYLGGALVGLGLVGTFVGLLGTLNDLGKIFESLMHVGARDVDPVAMFGNMIVKLQEPMRGMSTAFVASLYGLMGALVIGLVALSMRQVGVNLCNDAREILKADLYGNGISTDALAESEAPLSNALLVLLQSMPSGIDALVGSQNLLIEQNKQVLHEHRALFDRLQAIDIRLSHLYQGMSQQAEMQLAQQAKVLEAYQTVSLKKPMVILAAVSIGFAAVTALMVALIYWRLSDPPLVETKTEVIFTPLTVLPAVTAIDVPAAPASASASASASAPEATEPPVDLKKQTLKKPKVSVKPITPAIDTLEPFKPEAYPVDLCAPDQPDCVSDEAVPASSATRSMTSQNSHVSK